MVGVFAMAIRAALDHVDATGPLETKAPPIAARATA